MGLVRHVTTVELPNRVSPGLSHPFPAACKSLRLNIFPINTLNAISCEDFLAAALCFQYFAGKRGEGSTPVARGQGLGVCNEKRAAKGDE